MNLLSPPFPSLPPLYDSASVESAVTVVLWRVATVPVRESWFRWARTEGGREGGRVPGGVGGGGGGVSGRHNLSLGRVLAAVGHASQQPGAP